jgi:hypothetical protein
MDYMHDLPVGVAVSSVLFVSDADEKVLGVGVVFTS